MSNDVVPVEIRELFQTPNGCAIFIGNEEKVFVIQVEQMMGQVIAMFTRGAAKDRPLTHDLMLSVFKGFNIAVERVVTPARRGRKSSRRCGTLPDPTRMGPATRSSPPPQISPS